MEEQKPTSGRYKWGDAENEHVDVMTLPEYKHEVICAFNIRVKDLKPNVVDELRGFFTAMNDYRKDLMDSEDAEIARIFAQKEEEELPFN